MNDRTDTTTNETTPFATQPGPDGIRWELVRRVKKLIAENNYDTPERWAAAEELLFRSMFDDE